MSRQSFAGLFLEAEKSLDYWHEMAVIDFTDEAVAAMTRQEITRAELARRMGTSAAYITKMLGGDANFTLKTMTKVAMALDAELHVRLEPKTAASWAAKVGGSSGEAVSALELDARPARTVRPAAVVSRWRHAAPTDRMTHLTLGRGARDGHAARAA